jgi:hypothetical protein
VVQGRGNGIFDPDGLITRQEAATMLARAYQAYAGAASAPTGELPYSDRNAIAGWAADSVAILYDWQVMRGGSDSLFDPQGNYSIEQCLATFLRLYDNAPVGLAKGAVPALFTKEQTVGYLTHREYDTVLFRLEAKECLVMDMQYPGMLRTQKQLYIARNNGSLQLVDIGLYEINAAGMSQRPDLEKPSISEDGTKLRFTVTFYRDVEGYAPSESEPAPILFEKGVYSVEVLLRTGEVTTFRSDLPTL